MEKENLLMDYICDHIYKCDYKKRSNENLNYRNTIYIKLY